jgi:hypothetical protein
MERGFGPGFDPRRLQIPASRTYDERTPGPAPEAGGTYRYERTSLEVVNH